MAEIHGDFDKIGSTENAANRPKDVNKSSGSLGEHTVDTNLRDMKSQKVSSVFHEKNAPSTTSETTISHMGEEAITHKIAELQKERADLVKKLEGGDLPADVRKNMQELLSSIDTQIEVLGRPPESWAPRSFM